jgi:hypothetical protein
MSVNEKASQDSQDGIEVLRSAVSLWPKLVAKESPRVDAKLSALLTSNFDKEDFQNSITRLSRIVKVDENLGSRNIVFEDVDGSLYRASLVKDSNSEWRVDSLKFECPICFGEGLNDGATCLMCGGVGWGAG